MEVLTSNKSSTPVLLPNAKLMEQLEKDVKSNKKRMAKEIRKQKQRRRNRKDDKDRKIKNKFEHRDWIQEHVLEYLKGTPCLNIPVSKLDELRSRCMSKKKAPSKSKSSATPPSSPTGKKRRAHSSDAPAAASSPEAKESPSKSPSSPKALSPGYYGLTEAEALQVLNFMPQEPVEIHLMVEDLHDRMSEKKQEELLDMIRSYNTSVETTPVDGDGDCDGGGDTEEVVNDSIEMLEKAGNQALEDDADVAVDNDGDTAMKIKEEIIKEEI